MKKEAVTPQKDLIRSTEGLRDALFDEIVALRDGTGSATRLNAIARAAKTIVEVTALEMEMFDFRERHATPATAIGTSIKKEKPALETIFKLGSM